MCLRLHVQVSTLVSSLQPLIDRVAELEGRLTRSLAVAKQGLDILADQLVALGALNGRSSPNKNPLAGVYACAVAAAGYGVQKQWRQKPPLPLHSMFIVCKTTWLCTKRLLCTGWICLSSRVCDHI